MPSPVPVPVPQEEFDISIFVQNALLYAFGVAFNLAFILQSSPGLITEGLFFQARSNLSVVLRVVLGSRHGRRRSAAADGCALRGRRRFRFCPAGGLAPPLAGRRLT